ncbi:hypothetical protein M3J09_006988 [Ascochyta lentis]
MVIFKICFFPSVSSNFTPFMFPQRHATTMSLELLSTRSRGSLPQPNPSHGTRLGNERFRKSFPSQGFGKVHCSVPLYVNTH